MTYVPKFNFSLQLVTQLNAIERILGFLEGAPLTDEWIAAMQAQAIYKEAHATTHLYGSHLSWNESERLLTGHEVPDVRPDEVKALLNYKAAYAFMLELVKRQSPLTENDLLQMQKLLVRDVKGNRDHPGKYRSLQNYVYDKKTKELIYTPPQALEISIMMRNFMVWLDEVKLPPLIAAGIAQFQLAYIHPFVGGNGRTSRLLSQFVLHRADYDCKSLYALSPFYDTDITSYYEAIKTVRDNLKDQTQWLEYFTAGILKQLQQVLYEAKVVL